MYPLAALSIFALAGIMERLIFWIGILRLEKQTGENILAIARQDLQLAAQLAETSLKVPVGRFLYAPLALEDPDPELFRLALESSADEELAGMLKGEIREVEETDGEVEIVAVVGSSAGCLNPK